MIESLHTRQTILVVDDTPDSLSLLADMLGRQGYRVRAAINGMMALKTIEKSLPDLILLDINMPDMDGYEVCEHIKRDERTRHIPVLFISALDGAMDKVRAFASGGVDYVTKPFYMEEVLARVENQIAITQARDALARSEQAYRLAVQELSESNKQLVASIDELKQRNHEQEVLNRLSYVLQQAHTTEEAYQVGVPLLRDLFVGRSGALYVFNHESGSLMCVATWGDTPIEGNVVKAGKCRVLLAGQTGGEDTTVSAQQCVCQDSAGDKSFFCVQIRNRDEMIGVLYVRHDSSDSVSDHGRLMRQATMVADLFALSLSNIYLRERLLDQAIHDPLTKLYNRRFLEETLEREVLHAKRHQRTICIIMLDIDHFKRFNDTYGHDGGDAVLSTLAEYLRSNTRRSDIACRFGGEEFVIIMPETPLEAARRRAEQLAHGVRSLRVTMQGYELAPITVSMGLAGFPDHGSSPADLIRAADNALYHAKAGGRDRVYVAEQL